ncbi:hypothetical protein [Endozoicomonas atrinae]|uniref:hypothetical protein n=1 Tax=Endozoicomonas atrinae TaxID=1333660 RepID=UPI003AFF6BAC
MRGPDDDISTEHYWLKTAEGRSHSLSDIHAFFKLQDWEQTLICQDIRLNLRKPMGEFFSVYGGLQAGLGLGMIICGFQRQHVRSALLFSGVFSTVLFVFRGISIFLYGQHETTLTLLAVEGIIAGSLLFSFRHDPNESKS